MESFKHSFIYWIFFHVLMITIWVCVCERDDGFHSWLSIRLAKPRKLISIYKSPFQIFLSSWMPLIWYNFLVDVFNLWNFICPTLNFIRISYRPDIFFYCQIFIWNKPSPTGEYRRELINDLIRQLTKLLLVTLSDKFLTFRIIFHQWQANIRRKIKFMNVFECRGFSLFHIVSHHVYHSHVRQHANGLKFSQPFALNNCSLRI